MVDRRVAVLSSSDCTPAMKIDDELIERLATLSKLRFEGDEKDAIRQDLERMLDLVESLQKVDTEGVEPLIHMTDGANKLRRDELGQPTPQEEALKNAPSKDSYYFKVPKVISNPGN